MYEVIEKSKVVNGKEIRTFSRDVISANILEVEAGTNGYHGGDTGHGSRTYFRIENAGGTDFDVRPINPTCFGCDGFEVALGGDCELETMIRALKFITKVLEEESKEVYD